MDMDFAIPCPLVRPSLPHYPISVRRVAISLHASFRQSLAVLPLRFTRASPPSGCTGDFHPQAAGHAQHTRCVSAWTPIWGPNLTWTAAVADSHQPGEMMAAAQTFGQTLQRGGMDWHDFAALVSGEGKRLPSPSPPWGP